jgi:hypothetical protein
MILDILKRTVVGKGIKEVSNGFFCGIHGCASEANLGLSSSRVKGHFF